jgi:hypothetical protein
MKLHLLLAGLPAHSAFAPEATECCGTATIDHREVGHRPAV